MIDYCKCVGSIARGSVCTRQCHLYQVQTAPFQIKPNSISDCARVLKPLVEQLAPVGKGIAFLGAFGNYDNLLNVILPRCVVARRDTGQFPKGPLSAVT